MIVRSSASSARSTGWGASSTSRDRVVEIQKKLSALLEQLATDSTAENGEKR